MIYYFFTSLWLDSLSPINFLRSILHQMLSPNMLSPSLQLEVEDLFSRTHEPTIDKLMSFVFRLWGAIMVKHTFLIIDGVDELDRFNQKVILRILMDLYQKHPKAQNSHLSTTGSRFGFSLSQ